MGRTFPLKAIVVGVAAGLLLVLFVVVPVAAMHRSDVPLERFYGNAMVSLVSRVGAGGATSPFPGNVRAAAEGRIDYTGSCATCHGAKGDGRGALGTGTYPPATDLTSADAKALTDGQLYWIVKSGISFTAMPGFSEQYRDQDIWAMVEFIRALQRGATPGALPIAPLTRAQLAMADPLGAAPQRGAAVYLAEGCASCHGMAGEAIGLEVGRGADRVVRQGRPGMPAYGAASLSDAEMQDLLAYLQTLRGREGD